MHVDRVGHLAAAELQHGRPEQGVEGDDVLANEVHLLCGRVGQEGVELLSAQRRVTGAAHKQVLE